jgi:signal transduction histidine kinase
VYYRPVLSATPTIRAGFPMGWKGYRVLRLLLIGIVALVLGMFAASFPAGLTVRRFCVVVTALGSLLALNLFLAAPIPGASRRLHAIQGLSFLALSAALVFTTVWFSGQSSVVYLLSLVCAQATFRRGVWPFGAAFGTANLVVWVALQLAMGATFFTILGTETALAAGVASVLLLMTLLARYSAQTERAERLLAELQAASREVEAAHQREKELAVREERLRLARDLHDSVTQELYSVLFYAEAAADLVAAGETAPVTGHLGELRDTARQALREMRMLVFELHSPAFEAAGLAEAVQARLDAVEARSGVCAELRVEGSPRLASAVEAELYSIIREALNNVLKHARAHEVRVLLRFTPETARVEVSDDGVGFAAGGDGRCGGLGIRGMRERVERLGGAIRIESAPQRGTTVVAEVPSKMVE